LIEVERKKVAVVKPGFEAQIVNLGYGARQIPFRFDPQQFRVLARHDTKSAPLTDADLHAALDAPINSARLEQVIKPHERVVIVVPDATRAARVDRIAPLLVERLNRHGLSDPQISFLIVLQLRKRFTRFSVPASPGESKFIHMMLTTPRLTHHLERRHAGLLSF
jgi:nickel-dependent lactate racemase